MELLTHLLGFCKGVLGCVIEQQFEDFEGEMVIIPYVGHHPFFSSHFYALPVPFTAIVTPLLASNQEQLTNQQIEGKLRHTLDYLPRYRVTLNRLAYSRQSVHTTYER